MMRVQDVYPDLEMYWTEGGPDYTWPDYATDWAKWGKVFAEVLRNGCRSITGWNLALDEHGKPNIGPFNCGGMVTIHSQTKEISYSGQYWAFAHYSRFVRRGARRFDSQGGSGLSHVSFENPEGGRVTIIANPGSARTAEIRNGGQGAHISLPANSLATLQWKA
jgi:glucosylceramidase